MVTSRNTFQLLGLLHYKFRTKNVWGSGIKTHSLGGASIGYTGSELQLYVVYCTVPILNSIKKFTETVIQ